jgi:hypothetical protein
MGGNAMYDNKPHRWLDIVHGIGPQSIITEI